MVTLQRNYLAITIAVATANDCLTAVILNAGDIDILIASRKNHAIDQNNKNIPLKNKKVEQVEPVQINIHQSNNSRKDLSWLHFNNKPRV